MIYLDYSANTPVDEAVLERFCAVERSCPGNLIQIGVAAVITLIIIKPLQAAAEHTILKKA